MELSRKRAFFFDDEPSSPILVDDEHLKKKPVKKIISPVKIKKQASDFIPKLKKKQLFIFDEETANFSSKDEEEEIPDMKISMQKKPLSLGKP